MKTLNESPVVQVSTAELVQLSAVDNIFYEQTFFPRTVRQETPQFHIDMDKLLWGPDRHIGFKIFRGGAKTSKLRMYTSKRIAFAMSHTILYVSNSMDHSVKSLEWLKRHVEHNKTWAQTFGLRKGSRWTSEEIEIIHEIEGASIWVKAVGISGQLRGFNIEDRRPDTIIGDDIDSDETAGNLVQREKTSTLFFGALLKSLAPESEMPDAKAVVLQTPLAKGDLIDTMSNDPQWRVLEYGCFDERGESRWPERFPTEVLLKDKESYIRRRQFALWMREMEVTIVPAGGASFQEDNLKYYDLLPDRAIYIITIDPASSDAKTADDQVIMVLAGTPTGVYVAEYSAIKGEMPEQAIATLMVYIKRYNPLGIWAESTSYQRVLAHLIEQAMIRFRTFVPVHRVDDKRNKKNRILQAIGSSTAYGRTYVKSSHSKFIAQYNSFSPLSTEHDDVIDAYSIGVDVFTDMNLELWFDTEAGEAVMDHETPALPDNYHQAP